ncbi:hypothetical protein FRB99_001102 [Tulasnella sp. 403]|nr:hypothetical protein FRB99_001102 [Tulasnella sp. 403]
MNTIVSLPPHLHESLLALIQHGDLPDDLSEKLKDKIKPTFEESTSEISYDLLRQVSQWAQASDTTAKLKESSLDPTNYSMIALLAGTITSPKSKLPYKRPLSQEEIAHIKSKERKAISALINGVLSVVGCGVAAWWAAGSVGMRTDHKALLSVFAAIVVAATEAVLYWIWQWKYSNALKKHERSLGAKRKKTDGLLREHAIPEETVVIAQSGIEPKEDSGLRKRERKAGTETGDSPEGQDS